jgi:Uma2 family endonuclease
MKTLAINIPPNLKVTQEQFRQLAAVNRDSRLELTATGELIVMPPTGGNTGKRNIDLCFQLETWNRQTKLGVVFDSSTAFELPNGANRSPDVALVEQSRWDSLTPEERDSFPPLCPDFLIELRSKTDSIKTLKSKMQEYLDNGLRLGWLIDPQNKQVFIYRPQQNVEILESPSSLSGENILFGFNLNLQQIF